MGEKRGKGVGGLGDRHGDANNRRVSNGFMLKEHGLELGGGDLEAFDFNQFLLTNPS